MFKFSKTKESFFEFTNFFKIRNVFTKTFLYTVNCIFDFLSIRVRNQVLIHTFPDFDDHTEAICKKAKSTSVKIKVLTSEEFRSIPSFLQHADVEIVKKNSFRGLYLSKTSKWIMFSHGLYWARVKRKRQVVINLWHGIPFKVVGEQLGVKLPRADFLVASSKGMSSIFGDMYPSKNRPHILPFGLPRNDQFINTPQTQPQTSPKTILWLPTYRQSTTGELREDGSRRETNLGLNNDEIRILDTELHELGFRIVLKAHPATAINLPNDLKCITSIYSFHNNFYSQFIEFDGLITDYSSVAADFALTRKPVFLFGLDSDEYKKNRGFFVTPQKVLGLPFNSSIDQLVINLRNYEQSIVSGDTLRFLHNNVEDKATDLLWEFFSIKQDLQGLTCYYRKLINSLDKIKTRVYQFFAYGVSALTNITPLIFAYLYSPVGESAKVFIFVSIYTLILGLSRILFGDHFLLREQKNVKLRRLSLRMILVNAFLFPLLCYIADLNFETSTIVFAFLIALTGFAIMQDILRYFSFSMNLYGKVILADSMWLAITSLTYSIFFALEKEANAIEILLGFVGGGFFSYLVLIIYLRKHTGEKFSHPNSSPRVKDVLYLAGISVIGPLCNYLLNLILIMKSQGQLLVDLRGLQLFLLPVGFLLGLQQVSWLPTLKQQESKSQMDIFSVSLLGVLVPFIFVAIEFSSFGDRFSSLFVVLIILDTVIAFFIAQIGYKARANLNYVPYFVSRVFWMLLVLISATFTSSYGNADILAGGLLVCSLLSLITTRLLNRKVDILRTVSNSV